MDFLGLFYFEGRGFRWEDFLGHILIVELAYMSIVNQTNLERKTFYSTIDHLRISFVFR